MGHKIFYFLLMLIVILFSCTLSDMDGEKKIPNYSIKVNIIGSGTVSPSNGKYESGTMITLDASADNGYEFGGWIGDISGNINPYSLTMNSDKKFTAVFNQIGTGTVLGTVVDSVAGSSVSNAVVKSAGITAITDEDGNFILTGIPVGIHDIIVTKDGRANSKLQDVEINENITKTVEIVQTIYAYENNTSAVMPTINLDGIEKNGVYSEEFNYYLTVELGTYPVEGNSMHGSFMISYGGITSYPESSAISKLGGDDVLVYCYLYTNNFPAGDMNIRYVIYDLNNNRTELNLPITIISSEGTSPPDVKEQNYKVFSYTFGESGEYYSPKLTQIPGVEQTIMKSAPEDSSSYTEIYVNVVNNTTGISVYRSTSARGIYKLAGKTLKNIYDPEEEIYKYYLCDCSSEITPGENIYYKIAYFNGYSEGEKTGSINVRVLPKYNLYLKGPADNTVIYDISPSFYWESGVIENADRYDWIQLTDVTNGLWILVTEYLLLNQTEYHHNWYLKYNKLYHWDIRSVYQSIDGNVISLSYPSRFNSSVNGGFYFSITQ